MLALQEKNSLNQEISKYNLQISDSKEPQIYGRYNIMLSKKLLKPDGSIKEYEALEIIFLRPLIDNQMRSYDIRKRIIGAIRSYIINHSLDNKKIVYKINF